MEKIQIKATRIHNSNFFWSVITLQGRTNYVDSMGAFNYAQKYILRNRKEMSAFSIMCRIKINLLKLEELELMHTLNKNDCKGITKAQYGWLVGIYERQERSW